MNLVGNVQLVAGNAAAIDGIKELLSEAGIDTQGNPDVSVREYHGFGVDDARELSARASARAVASSRRVFIVVTPDMTSNAQNALLKTLEEPSGDALFFIVVPFPETLLPTLRSRAQTLVLDAHTHDALVDASAFLKAASAKRLDMLKPLYEKDDDEARDIGAAVQFLTALERLLGEDPEKNRGRLDSVYRARTFIGDKGSLVKALLEQVALLI